MIEREIKKELVSLVSEFQVVVILGPRQSGKTTLAKMLQTVIYFNDLK
jgi:predicted AAA+ superfamily ATPase